MFSLRVGVGSLSGRLDCEELLAGFLTGCRLVECGLVELGICQLYTYTCKYTGRNNVLAYVIKHMLKPM